MLGTLSGMALVNSWYFPMLLKRLLHVPLRPLVLAVVIPIAIGVPYGVTVWWVAYRYPPHGWIDLAVKMSGSALLYLEVAWVAIFTSDERALWRLRLRLLVRPQPAQ